MRITVVTSSYPRFPGDGAAPFIKSICQHLAELGHQIEVVAPYDPLVCDQPSQSIPVHRFRYAPVKKWHIMGHARALIGDMHFRRGVFLLLPLFLIAEFWTTLWVAWRQKADIIYAHWLVPGGFIGAIVSRLTSIPMVIHLHGSDVFVVERYKVLRAASRFALNAACHVIACSTNLANRVTNLGLPAERVSVIPYGVDVEQYMLANRTTNLPEQSFGNSRKVVMGMGRLVPKKGFAYLLRAAPIVLDRFPHTFFVIAGEGDSRSDLEALAKAKKVQEYVLFIGYVPWDHTPSYLKVADVFVVPSVQDEAGNIDGLPNVLLEAMAAGCAVVASRIAGIPEVIRDGESGLLVPPQNEVALAEAICLLLGDEELRRQLGEAAQRTVATRYRWTQIAKQVAVVLQAALTKKLSKNPSH